MVTTDTKLIEVTAGTLTTAVSTVSVTSNTVTTSINTGVVTPLIESTDVQEELLNVVISGLGEENIPDARLFKFVADNFNLNEQAVIRVFKSLSELSTAEDQVRKLLQKALIDATSNSEVFVKVWTAYRTFTDSANSTEVLQKDFHKVLADLANAPDLLTTSVGKYLSDVTALANLSYAVILVGKTLQDQTIGFSDVLSRIVQFNRTFEDTLFTTDDFLGAANIDDDQIATVLKVLIDWATPQETFSVDLIRPDITDQALVAEQAALLSSIPKFDQIEASEAQFSDIDLLKIDPVTTAEQQIFDITKPDRLDQAVTNEQASISNIKPFTDDTTNSEEVSSLFNQVSLDETTNSEEYSFDVESIGTDIADASESIELGLSKTAADDILSVSELLLTKLIGININEIDYFLEDYTFDSSNYTFKAVHANDAITQIIVSKTIQDLVDATDDFEGAANIDDDQIATFDKVAVDYIGFYEAFDRLVDYIRLFTETANALDQVSLQAEKVAFDQISNTDDVNTSVTKNVTEQASLAEVLEFNAQQQSLDQAGVLEQAELSSILPKIENITSTDAIVTFYEAIREFNELTNSSIQVEKLLQKVSVDLSTVSELIQQTVSKVLAEEITNTEQLSFDYSAEYSDLVDATDDFYGAANIDDDQIAAFDKVIADYVDYSETVVTVAEFYRVFIELAGSTDLAVLNFAKVLVEIANISDILSIEFDTAREEIATATDTISNGPSIVAADSIAQSDLFTKSIEPAKYETVTLDEVVNYTASAEKLELLNTLETDTKDITVIYSDIGSILETFVSEFIAYRDFYENITQTDLVNLTVNKNTTETSITSDLVTTSSNKQLLDTGAISEVFSKIITSEFTDSLVATDDFEGVANIDDDQIADFQKSVSDYTSNSEVITRVVTFLRTVTESQILSEVFTVVNNKVFLDITNSSDTVQLLATTSKSDNVATSQSISLTLQSYFSGDYAQLGYTGETYTY